MPCAHAMDLELYKRENPFNMLPLELRGRIIKDVFNLIIHEDKKVKSCIDQEKLEKYVLRVPTWLGIQCIQEFRQLQEICQNKIGDKTMLPHQLFVLDRKYRDIFIRMANRSWLSELEGNIDRDDLKKLMAIEDKDIKKGLVLKVSRGEIYKYIYLLGAIGVVAGIFVIYAAFPSYDQWSCVHKLIGNVITCCVLGAIPSVFLLVCFESLYVYRDYCHYDSFGQLQGYSRFRNCGGYEDRTL